MKNLSISLLFLCAVILGGCQPLPSNGSSSQTVTKYQSIGPFSNVVVSGAMDVELSGQSSAKKIIFVGPQDFVGTVVASVENGTLYLRSMALLSPKDTIRTRVQIPATGTLTSISYNGPGVLTGEHLRTQNFKLIVNGSRYVNLSGPRFALRSLEASGNGKIIISSIDAEHLDVKSSSDTRITLSGTAKSTNIVLAQNSSLNARELITQKSYTNTTSNAWAEVRVVKLLNAFSTGYSNIYYYGQEPELLNKYLRQRGSVLYFPAT